MTNKSHKHFTGPTLETSINCVPCMKAAVNTLVHRVNELMPIPTEKEIEDEKWAYEASKPMNFNGLDF